MDDLELIHNVFDVEEEALINMKNAITDDYKDII